jgi:hypothetical protein
LDVVGVPLAKVTSASILLEAEDGVIEAVNPVMSTKLVLAVLKEVSLTTLTTCNTLPAGRTEAAIVPVN